MRVVGRCHSQTRGPCESASQRLWILSQEREIFPRSQLSVLPSLFSVFLTHFLLPLIYAFQLLTLFTDHSPETETECTEPRLWVITIPMVRP